LMHESIFEFASASAGPARQSANFGSAGHLHTRTPF